MKKQFVLIIMLLVAIGACQRDEITVYEARSYIHFEKSFVDSVTFSFVAYPAENQINYPVVVSLVGRPADRDLEYQIAVVDSYTTAPAANYSLPTSFTLKKGAVSDTFQLKLLKTPDLQTNSIRLALQVIGTDDLAVGEIERSVFVLWYTDRITQPAWWNSTIQQSFLGSYSDKKYRLFIQVTGIGDMTDYEYYDLRYYTLIFKNYLREQEAKGAIVYEEDGTTKMAVALIGG
jgi:hypothetical protein